MRGLFGQSRRYNVVHEDSAFREVPLNRIEVLSPKTEVRRLGFKVLTVWVNLASLFCTSSSDLRTNNTHYAFLCINLFIDSRSCSILGPGRSGTSRLVGTYSIGVDPELSGMNSSAAEVEVSRAL